MAMLVGRVITVTGKTLTLLCLLTFFVSGCSITPKTEDGSSLLVKSIPKENHKPMLGEFILNSAKSQMGIHYKFGGTSPKVGFDCSGLTWYSHKKNGINIPRQSSDQFMAGKRILRKDLMPGDLVFFETYRPGASHVGIYTGDGNFIHSLNSNKTIAIQALSTNYYKKRYLGARRYW